MSEKPSDAATGDVRPEGDVSDEKVKASDQNERDGSSNQEKVRRNNAQKDTTYFQGLVQLVRSSPTEHQVLGSMPSPCIFAGDHERAYFDSADWALGKQGGNPQKPKGPLEALRPKLQPTQQQTRARRFLGESAENEDSVHSPAEDPNSPTKDAGQIQDHTEGKDNE